MTNSVNDKANSGRRSKEVKDSRALTSAATATASAATAATATAVTDAPLQRAVQSDKFFAEQLEAHFGEVKDGFLLLSDGGRIRKSAVAAYRREGLHIRFLLVTGDDHCTMAMDAEHAVLLMSRLDILFGAQVF